MYVVLQRKRQSAEDKVGKEHSVCGYINKNIYMNIFCYSNKNKLPEIKVSGKSLSTEAA